MKEEFKRMNLTNTKKNILPDVGAVILLILFLLLFFWPTLTKGLIYSLDGMMGSDNILIDYPHLKVFRDALLRNHLPWWIHGIANGFPLVAEGQIGAFYPPNLLFYRFFDTTTALNLTLFLHAVIAAVGAYFLTLRFTKHRVASILSGVVFALSGAMIIELSVVNVFSTISLFPFIFLCYLSLLESFDTRRFAILSILLGFQILAGYIPIAYFGWILLFVTGIAKGELQWKRQVSFIAMLLSALCLSAGMSAIQLVPTVELTQHSAREQIDFKETTQIIYPFEGVLTLLGIRGAITPESIYQRGEPGHIKSLYSYYSYIGLLPLFLIPIGTWCALKSLRSYPILIVSLFAFLMTIGDTTPFFGLVWNIVPGMKLFRISTYYLRFLEFFFALLVGFGFSTIYGRLVRQGYKKFFINISSLTVVIVVFIDLFINQRQLQPLQPHTFWTEKPEIVSILGQNKWQERISSPVSFRFTWSYMDDWKIQHELRNLLLADYNVLFNIATIHSNVAMPIANQLQISEITLDVDKLILDESVKQLQNKGRANAPIELSQVAYNLYVMQGVKYIISPIELTYVKLKSVWKYVFTKPMEFKIPVTINQSSNIEYLPLIVRHLFVYEVEDTIPRVALIQEAKFFHNKNDVAVGIFKKTFDPHKTVFIEGKTSNPTVGSTGEAQITREEDVKTTIAVQSQKGGWLYLSDVYYPGWKAFVDGEETNIYRANYAFRAIEVPAGKHIVEFVYDPLSRKVGVLITLVTITALTSTFVFGKRIEKIYPNRSY